MISLKTKEEIEKLKEGGKILIKVLRKLALNVKPGLTTLDLDYLAEKLILGFGVKPSFKGHDNYPYTLCASVNDEVVHGLPSKRILKEGDIVSLDLGVFYKGFHTDAALTVPVGKIDSNLKKLIKTTYQALKDSLKAVKAGNYIVDISEAIQKRIEKEGFSAVRSCTGHGIGRKLHEEPNIPNFVTYKNKKKVKGVELQDGMILCVEPIANIGSHQVKVKTDGWTVVTKDSNFSAHFEETIAIRGKKPIRITNLDSILNF